MAMSSSEQKYLQELLQDSNSALTQADYDALVKAKVPIGCLLKAAAELFVCGLTKPKCIGEFVVKVIECFKKGN